MSLRAVTHESGRHNRWCGPAAVSVLTGMTAEDAARAIRRVTGKTQCTRVKLGDLLRALRQQGLVLNAVGIWSRGTGPTTAAWLKTRRQRTRATDTYLVAQTTHFIVVRGDMAVDNQTGKPVPLAKITGRRARVAAAYLVLNP